MSTDTFDVTNELKRQRRKNKGPRLRKQRNRRHNIPFPWGLHYNSWCFNCRREIQEYDLVQMGSYYDSEGLIFSWVHFDCREVSNRPRIHQPEASVHINADGTRKLTMATTTKTRKGKKARKSRKQKAAEEEELQAAAGSEEDQDEEQEDEEETPAPKPKRSRKSRKAKAEAEAEEEDEDEEDDEDEDEEEEPKAKKSRKGKAKGDDSSGASFAQTTGERLLDVLEKADAPKKLVKIATALSKGKEVSHADLTTLKEGIKEVAAKDREGKGKHSPTLSALNSRVRRLERAAR